MRFWIGQGIKDVQEVQKIHQRGLCNVSQVISSYFYIISTTSYWRIFTSVGPLLLNGNMKKSFHCKGIHPFPLMFESSLILIPEVKYLLSLHMSFQINGELSDFPVATIWGFQGVPRIKTPGQDLLRWKQVYRKGLSSSVSSGQFPLVYYIK